MKKTILAFITSTIAQVTQASPCECTLHVSRECVEVKNASLNFHGIDHRNYSMSFSVQCLDSSNNLVVFTSDIYNWGLKNLKTEDNDTCASVKKFKTIISEQANLNDLKPVCTLKRGN